MEQIVKRPRGRPSTQKYVVKQAKTPKDSIQPQETIKQHKESTIKPRGRPPTNKELIKPTAPPTAKPKTAPPTAKPKTAPPTANPKTTPHKYLTNIKPTTRANNLRDAADIFKLQKKKEQ
jgi:hypothetical protein